MTGKRGPSLDDHAVRFIEQLRKEGLQQGEISVFKLGNRAKLYAKLNALDPSWLMWQLMRRGYVEVSAADTYVLRMDKVRK